MAMAPEKICFESIFSLIAEQILELPTVAIYLLVAGVGDLADLIKVLIDSYTQRLSFQSRRRNSQTFFTA